MSEGFYGNGIIPSSVNYAYSESYEVSKLQDYRDSNLKFWDSVVAGHVNSEFYDVVGFLNGNITLDDIELRQVGNVTGKTLLHLQCHFGISTLSWARQGALVTGVDFSPAAIKAAKQLSLDSGIPGNFVVSNIYDIAKNLGEKYDIVFTSYGVLCWLPDLDEWAKQIADCMKTDGKFHIVEYHPLMTALDSGNDFEIALKNSYFNEGVEVIHTETSYAIRNNFIDETTYEWSHPISEVITALIKADLIIEEFTEYPYTSDGGFVTYLKPSEDGKWRPPNYKWGIPLTYSISGSKR